MTDETLAWGLAHTVADTDFGHLGTKYRGKVRDTYADDDRLVLVTTDRISAFDHILRQTIPFKGQILNKLAAFFFDKTADLVPNHVLAVPHGNVTVARRLTPIPVEFVVRGYLVGHAWRVYRDGGRMLCGVELPEGLRQNSRFEHPILTPATKADEGHDEDIAPAEIVRRGLLDEETLNTITAMSRALFTRGTQIAAARGLLLADTKYEFGIDTDGTIRVMDEIHTPDSSRYFYADGYDERLARDEPQRQLSKEFVREWLMDRGFQGQTGQPLPDLDDAFRIDVTRRYVELYETLVGQPFEPDLRPLDTVL